MFLKQDREKHKKLSIGMLDVFGFEVFKTNSFEQLCINYCNETLQQFYLNHVFKLEQNRCASEGMQLEHIDFQDNKETLDLLANQRLSIIDHIDEEIKVPKVRSGSQYATQAYEMTQGESCRNFVNYKRCEKESNFTMTCCMTCRYIPLPAKIKLLQITLHCSSFADVL